MNRSKKDAPFRVSNRVQILIPLALLFVLLLTGCSAAEQSGPIAAVLQSFEQATDSVANQITAGLTPTDTPRLLAAQDGTLQNIYAQVNPSVVHIQVVGAPRELPFEHPELPDSPGESDEAEKDDGPDEDAGHDEDATDPEDSDGPEESNGDQSPDNPIFDDPPQAYGEGSGFVWDKKGHIVTNNHVVDSAEKITVLFADDTAVRAELVGTDPDSDLAVLLVDLPASQLQPVSLGDSAGLQVGDLAIAIGNPFGQEGTMTVGIVSALGRLLPIVVGNPFAPRFNIPDVIQTDAAINPGNSGGVLLDDQGHVVGVTTAIISGSQANSGIGFAVPSAIVKQVVPALIENGHYDHPYIGISGGSLTPELAEAMDLPPGQRGVLLGKIMEGGPAEKAGLQANDERVEIDGFEIGIGGDIIIAADDEPITSMDDLITFLGRHTQVGQTIELTFLRDGQEEQIELKLSARPAREDNPLAFLSGNPSGEEIDRPRLGIMGQSVSPELADELDLPAGQAGILITQVVPGSPAHEVGVLEDDVITTIDGKPLAKIEDLLGHLTDVELGDEIKLSLLRDGEELELGILLGENSDD